MESIDALVTQFLDAERPLSVVLDPATVLAQAVAATQFYAGFATLEAYDGIDPPYPEIDQNTTISYSEWALIKPLFYLYIERESAIQLEASRGLGVDVFGRSSSEIDQDIANAHREMPMNAFMCLVETI
jgi:hypothetical protein